LSEIILLIHGSKIHQRSGATYCYESERWEINLTKKREGGGNLRRSRHEPTNAWRTEEEKSNAHENGKIIIKEKRKIMPVGSG